MNELKINLKERVYCNWYLIKTHLFKDKELLYFLYSTKFFIIIYLFILILHNLYLMVLLI